MFQINTLGRQPNKAKAEMTEWGRKVECTITFLKKTLIEMPLSGLWVLRCDETTSVDIKREVPSFHEHSFLVFVFFKVHTLVNLMYAKLIVT